jgi:serine/threonine-protein kinase
MMDRPGDTAAVEAVLGNFEDAWQSGAAPPIDTFAAGLAPAALVELVKLDIEYRWRFKTRGGGPRSLEDYARHFPALGPQLSDELIQEEYRVRHRWGDQPGHGEYATRFAGQGQPLLDGLRAVDAELAAEFARLTPPAAVLVAQPVDPADSIATLVQMIDAYRLINPAQFTELTTELVRRFTDPRALGRELLQRDWLTAYQVNQLLLGRDAELRLGPYILLERLGEGGTGWVFKARHEIMHRLVAIKIFRRELVADAEVLGRFYREIQVVSQLAHPHVIHAYDAGPIDDRHVLVMEYAPGVDLSRLVKRSGPLPVAQAGDYVRQAALGLQYIHERGLVHRDVKPSNLLVTQGQGSPSRSLVKVLDLGLSRLGRVEPRVGPINRNVPGGSSGRLTPVGAMVMGTPDYLAPEQALDFHQADIRADVYGLGCTFFYLLTGQPPFPGGSLVRKLVAHQQADPPTIERLRPEVPRALVPVLARMLAKEPHERYATPTAFLDALYEALPDLSRADTWSGSSTSITALPPGSLATTASSPAPPAPPPRQRRRKAVMLASIGLALPLLAGLGYALMDRHPMLPSNRAAVSTTPVVMRIAPVATLYSTGVDGNGTLLTDGQVDPHWTITATPTAAVSARAFATLNKWPVGSAWLPNNYQSRWISPQADETTGDPPGAYIYRTTFDLSGFDLATMRITGRTAADNRVLDVRLNGQSMGLMAEGFNTFTPFEITRGFIAGRNVLEFIVRNDGDTTGANPSGLRVELTGSGAVVPRR